MYWCIFTNKLAYDSLSLPLPPASAMAVSGVMLLVLVLLIPVWLWLAYRNKATKSVLFYGWFPVVAAVFISRSVGGSAPVPCTH